MKFIFLDLLNKSQILLQNFIRKHVSIHEYFEHCHFQEALAQALWVDYKRMDDPDCYFYSLPRELESKRDRMAQLLQEVGLTPVIPEGGYFMIVDVSTLSKLKIYIYFI